MAGKARLEHGGACYHAISRGNCRECLFKADRAKRSFEEILAVAANHLFDEAQPVHEGERARIPRQVQGDRGRTGSGVVHPDV